jgi:Fibronectin type III domain
MMLSRSVRVPLIMMVVTTALTAAALTVNNSARAVVKTPNSGVWIANDNASSVTHVGPGGTDVTVALENVVGDFSVVQMDGVAFITDGSGALTRVDAAQLTASQTAQLANTESYVTAGGGVLYQVDVRAGSVQQFDATTARPVGPVVVIGKKLGNAVVDNSGVLWVTDADTGKAISVNRDKVSSTTTIASPGVPIVVSVVGAKVVAINRTAATVTVISGGPSAKPVQLTPGKGVQAPDSVLDGSVLPILDDDNQLNLVDIDGGRSVGVSLPKNGDKLGSPRTANGKVYVPNYTKGTLIVIDIKTGAVINTIEITKSGITFELLVDKSTVYVNDPSGSKAWAITAEGTLIPATKYDPANPTGGTGPTVTAVVAPPPSTTPSTTTTVPKPPVSTPKAPTEPPAPRPSSPRQETTTTTEPKSASTAAEPEEPKAPKAPIIIVTSTTVKPPKENPAPPQPAPGTPAQPAAPTPATPPAPGPATPPGNPPAPTGDGAARSLSATAGDAAASVSWQPPTNWNVVTGYTVTLTPGGKPVTLKADATNYSVSGLTNGTAYTFTVRAESKEAPGSAQTTTAVTPTAAAPGAPKITSVVPGDGQVSVAWEATAKATAYDIEVVAVDGSPSMRRTAGATETSANIAGLSNGKEYYVVLKATTAGGGSPATTSSTFTPRGVPSAPGSPTAAVTGPGQVTVSWSAAGANGNAITGYTVIAASSPTGGTTATPAASGATSVVINSLATGSTYTFSVTATNSIGTSAAATTSVLVQSQVPSPPTGLSASAQDGSVALSWNAADGNGTTVASYTVRNLTDGTSASAGSATSFVVPGLTNGVAYNFDVQAIGANGAAGPVGTPSAPVTPNGAPAAPNGIAAAATSPTEVTLAFSQVSPTNGTTVSQWTVTSNATPTPQPATSGMVFKGLTPATAYTFSLVAIGANGLSSPPISATVTTPSGLPQALTGLTARSSGAKSFRINLAWTPTPGADSYRIEVDNVVTQSGVIGTSAFFSGGGYDNNGVVRVIPVNAYGDGGSMVVNWSTPPDPNPGCVTPPGKPQCIPP